MTDLPIQTLKLDKSLIDNIDTDERAFIKAQAIIRLAHELGYTTVAEGAETLSQVEQIQKLACDEIQGFALAKPMSALQLTEKLKCDRGFY